MQPAHQFTPEETRRGSEKGAATRTRLANQRRLAHAEAYRLVTELDDIAPAALEAAFNGLRRGTEAMDTVEIESTLDVKRLIESAELAHRIYRLASGQSTSNVAHAGDQDRAERLAALRARLAQHDATNDTPPADT